MEYSGTSLSCRVRIVAEPASPWLKRYSGQACDAILYDPPINPQIDTEQLTPPLPKWQSCNMMDIEVVSPVSK